ncbi:MAG: hypothetical protein NVSMB64_00040 [Candidatus Velthaea sp.]
MKLMRIILAAIAALVVGGIIVAGFSGKAGYNRVAHQAQQHEAIHRQNVERQKWIAFEAHLKRAAYDKAHPEEVARSKAAAAKATRVAAAQAAAEVAQSKVAAAEAARFAAAQVAAEAAKRAAAQQVADAAEHARKVRQYTIDHACDTANELELKAAGYENADNMQATYDTSVSGLHSAELCDNTTEALLEKGYLLSFKAYAEHGLGNSEWRTDYNQANALLVQCQTTPGLYGTHAGAQCETQETNNIKQTTNWDVGN